MKMYLDSDEWYPVYSLREDRFKFMNDYMVDVSPEFMEKYNRIVSEFNSLQDELDKLTTVKVLAEVYGNA